MAKEVPSSLKVHGPGLSIQHRGQCTAGEFNVVNSGGCGVGRAGARVEGRWRDGGFSTLDSIGA